MNTFLLNIPLISGIILINNSSINIMFPFDQSLLSKHNQLLKMVTLTALQLEGWRIVKPYSTIIEIPCFNIFIANNAFMK